jgi:hypothetical protein
MDAVELTHAQQEEARQIAIRAVGKDFTSNEQMKAWFLREANDHELLAAFAAYMFFMAREAAELMLFEALLDNALEALQ